MRLTSGVAYQTMPLLSRHFSRAKLSQIEDTAVFSVSKWIGTSC